MSDAELLDPIVLDGLVADLGDRALVAELLQTYLNELDGRLDAIDRAVNDHDCVELARAAHALKSPSATLGVVAMVRSCWALEFAARSTSRPPAEVLAILARDVHNVATQIPAAFGAWVGVTC